MGLLANGKDKTLTYKESKKYQRILKKIAALQITKLMKIFQNFSNSETDRLKYGIEQEFHLVTSFEYQRKSENKDLGNKKQVQVKPHTQVKKTNQQVK